MTVKPQIGDIWEYNFDTPEYHLTYHLLVLGSGIIFNNYYQCLILETGSIQETNFMPTRKESYRIAA